MFRRISHPRLFQYQSHARRLLSSDEFRKNKVAADLRALRSKTKTTKRSGNSNDHGPVNYRYRSGQENPLISTLWGKSLQEEKEDENKVNLLETEFVPFFDLVDAHMSVPRLGSSDMPLGQKSNIELLFDRIDQESDVPKQPSSKIIETESDTGQRKSILDAFQIKTESKRQSAFLDEDFSQYMNLMDDLKSGGILVACDQSISDWLQSDEKVIDYHLPLLSKYAQNGTNNVDELAVRDELAKQRTAFMKALNIDDDQYQRAVHYLVTMGHKCAKFGKAQAIKVAWEKVKEAGMTLKSDSLNTYLYASSTFQNRSLSSSPLSSVLHLFNREDSETANGLTPTQSEGLPLKKEVDVAEEVAVFHDSMYPPSEQTISVRVKAMVSNGNGYAAERLLEQSQIPNLKLRTYYPILKMYLDRGELSSALRVFKRMRELPSVVLEAENYVHLIATLAESGFFHPDAPAIEGCVELGFDPPSGPALLDQLVSALAEDILEITPGLAKRLHSAITTAFKDTEHGTMLEVLHPLAMLQVDNRLARPEDVIASRVAIDPATGTCPKTGVTLRLITLDDDARRQLKNGLLELCASESQKFKKKTYRGRPPPNYQPSGPTGDEELERFLSWLDTRKGEPFTAIIDGANVAYHLQNFDSGKFNLYQLDFMVRTLERMKESPLVILPAKYTNRSFHSQLVLDHSKKQVLCDREMRIIANLQRSGKVYTIPFGYQDDHFWMLASISEQIESRQGRSLEVFPDDPHSRWPGKRPMLITNDQVRDHKISLLEPRLFRRWYSSNIVNYSFTGFVDADCVDDQIGFSPADFFSREIQGNISHGDSIAWHFPVSDWLDNERFCLRVPRK